jgi:exodeoxyribonuclease VII large subunit
LPKRIGIITSPTGAAIRDILKIIKRRFENVEILISPVKVQGEEAAYEISQAIYQMNKLDKQLLPDVIILARGGGSIEDLWAFNEEIVARAIYSSSIPIISGIGHEIDFTIADFVADVRAPTPSGAAELVIKSKEELKHRIDFLSHKLINLTKHKINDLLFRLERCKSSQVFVKPHYNIMHHQQRVDEASSALVSLTTNKIKEVSAKFDKLTAKLTSLSPLNILKRGYSITYHKKTNKVIKEATSLAHRDEVKVKFYKGGAKAYITRLAAAHQLSFFDE